MIGLVKLLIVDNVEINTLYLTGLCKIYKSLLDSKALKEISFLTLYRPRGLPLTSKIVWH